MGKKLTEEQIKGLENRQKCTMMHDYTCMGHNGCIRSENSNGTLIPTEDKWVCPCGKYTQEYDQSLIDSIPKFLEPGYLDVIHFRKK